MPLRLTFPPQPVVPIHRTPPYLLTNTLATPTPRSSPSHHVPHLCALRPSFRRERCPIQAPSSGPLGPRTRAPLGSMVRDLASPGTHRTRPSCFIVLHSDGIETPIIAAHDSLLTSGRVEVTIPDAITRDDWSLVREHPLSSFYVFAGVFVS
ncbi:hypothetical protein BDW22DRAFT_1359959, partial [Trametopsis cervina]